MRVGRSERTQTPVSIALAANVTVGPETAAKLGVPVGTVVPYGEIAYWNRSRLRTVAWRIRNRNFTGRIRAGLTQEE